VKEFQASVRGQNHLTKRRTNLLTLAMVGLIRKLGLLPQPEALVGRLVGVPKELNKLVVV